MIFYGNVNDKFAIYEEIRDVKVKDDIIYILTHGIDENIGFLFTYDMTNKELEKPYKVDGFLLDSLDYNEDSVFIAARDVKNSWKKWKRNYS